MARTKVDKDANTTVKTVRRTTEIIEITNNKERNMYNTKKARKHHVEQGCWEDAQEENYEQSNQLEYLQQLTL